jgi:hypothetical protein
MPHHPTTQTQIDSITPDPYKNQTKLTKDTTHPDQSHYPKTKVTAAARSKPSNHRQRHCLVSPASPTSPSTAQFRHPLPNVAAQPRRPQPKPKRCQALPKHCRPPTLLPSVAVHCPTSPATTQRRRPPPNQPKCNAKMFWINFHYSPNLILPFKCFGIVFIGIFWNCISEIFLELYNSKCLPQRCFRTRPS